MHPSAHFIPATRPILSAALTVLVLGCVNIDPPETDKVYDYQGTYNGNIDITRDNNVQTTTTETRNVYLDASNPGVLVLEFISECPAFFRESRKEEQEAPAQYTMEARSCTQATYSYTLDSGTLEVDEKGNLTWSVKGGYTIPGLFTPQSGTMEWVFKGWKR